jgi:hypothetical protein
LVTETKGAAQIGGPGLFGDERVGAGFNDASVDVFGAEDAAQARGGFVEDIVDAGARVAAVLFEGEGGGESGDASADDGDASQCIPQRLKPVSILPS